MPSCPNCQRMIRATDAQCRYCHRVLQDAPQPIEKPYMVHLYVVIAFVATVIVAAILV